MSICLGAIAGICGGFIASWWNAKEDYVTDEAGQTPAEKEAAIAVAQTRPRRYGMGVKLARQPQEARAVKKRFGWLFRR